jgi:phosphatidate cytidylyltransferase
MKELAVRVVVALAGIPLLFFLIIEGGLFFYSLILIVGIFGQWEMLGIVETKALNSQRMLAIISGILILSIIQFGYSDILVIALILSLWFIFTMEMFLNKGSSILNISGTLLSIIYPILFLGTLLFLRGNAHQMVSGENGGAYYILNIFVAVWACDTFAYFIGSMFGKHKLLKRVSPKKSMEGAAAGLFGAVLTFILAFGFNLYTASLSLIIASGLIVGIGGQLGDLVESWFKRDAGIKDSSKILPGHGGFLDRFDSLLFVSPLFLILYVIYH